MAVADLTIRISGDIKDYDEALSKAQGETAALSDKIGEIAKVAAIAFAALTAEVGASIIAFKESEQVANQLSVALRNQGLSSKALVEKYQDQATALQRLTGISDETIVKSQTILQSFVGQQEVTEQLTQAVLDFSAAKQIDATSASEIFGKAIEGNTMLLKRYGIEIDANLTQQQRIDQIIKKVTESFGGQAKAAGDGLGSLNKLREEFNNLQEVIGQRFAPAVEFVATKLQNLFIIIENNPVLVTFISTLIGGGIAISGFVLLLAGLTTAILAATAAATAFGVTAAVAFGPIILAAAAVTALGGALGYFATRNKEAQDEASKTSKKIEDLKNELTSLQERQQKFGNILGPTNAVIDAKKREIEKLEELEEKQQQRQLQRETSKNTLLDEETNKAAQKRETERQRIDRLTITREKEKTELLRLQEQDASEEIIKIKEKEIELISKLIEEKNKVNRQLLQERLDEERKLEEEARQSEFDRQNDFENELLASNEEFQKLTEDQKEAFILKNQAATKSQLQNENLAQQQAASDRLAIQTKEHNTFLLNQTKFGIAYATIYKIMHNTIVQGAANAFGELAALQTSSNSTLKSIGKVAATAQIIIKTAESAMNIYAGFSTIPIIGPVLGAIGAAAAVAFGVEQIGKVNAAAEGGLLQGGIPGVDSIPVLAQAGELITPRQNFDEVVNAVANQRAGVPGDGGTTDVNVTISLKDNIMDFIETNINKRKRLGTSILT